jgi:hypothetical protein
LQLEANTPHQWLLVSLPMGSSFVNDWVGWPSDGNSSLSD